MGPDTRINFVNFKTKIDAQKEKKTKQKAKFVRLSIGPYSPESKMRLKKNANAPGRDSILT